MTQFNQALIAAASSIAMFGGAMTLITPAAKADTLYSDPFSYDTFGGRQTFNNGDYTRLDNNDITPLRSTTTNFRTGTETSTTATCSASTTPFSKMESSPWLQR